MNAKSCGATADWANEWCTGGPEGVCYSVQWKGKGESQKRGAERGTSSTESGRERGMKVGRGLDEIMCEVWMCDVERQ